MGPYLRGVVLLALIVVAVSYPLIASANQRQVTTMDEQFATVAKRVPSFGGAYFDEAGTLVILLTTPSDEAARQSRDALVEILGKDYAVETYKVLEATYSFVDLKRWYEAIRDIHLVAPDLAFKDIDEQRNRITLAFEDPDRHRPALEAELVRLGVPLDAVNIEQSGLAQPGPLPSLGLKPFLVGLLVIMMLSAAGLLVWRHRGFAPKLIAKMESDSVEE